MIRSAESVVHNIVEGCGAAGPKEFGRFLEIAIKSASELESQVELARTYGVLRHHEWQELTDSVVSLRRMLCTLRKRVLHPARRGGAGPADRQAGVPTTEHLAAPCPIEGRDQPVGPASDPPP